MTQERPEPIRRRTWLAPLIALGLALVFLLVLMIPGVLRYPGRPDPAQLDALRDANAALEDEIARLGEVEAGGVCYWDGDLYPNTVEGAAEPPDPSQRLDLLPPAPTGIVPSPDAVPEDAGFEGDMDDLLRRATVLVIAADAEGMSSGTGFFVDDRHIATNSHVVGEASEVIVTNDTIEAPLRATVVARTALGEEMNGPEEDFALLRLSQPEPRGVPLALASAQRTQPVYASGYPGFFVAEQVIEYYQAAASGQPATPPEGIVTNGIVTTVQQASRPTGGTLGFIPHTADTSFGNSGGPLVDACGRAVGVNTFVRQDGGPDDIIIQGDYALASENLADFLRANGVSPRMIESGCDGGQRRDATE